MPKRLTIKLHCNKYACSLYTALKVQLRLALFGVAWLPLFFFQPLLLNLTFEPHFVAMCELASFPGPGFEKHAQDAARGVTTV